MVNPNNGRWIMNKMGLSNKGQTTQSWFHASGCQQTCWNLSTLSIKYPRNQPPPQSVIIRSMFIIPNSVTWSIWGSASMCWISLYCIGCRPRWSAICIPKSGGSTHSLSDGARSVDVQVINFISGLQSVKCYRELGEWYRELGEWYRELGECYRELGEWYRELGEWYRELGERYRELDECYRELGEW